MRAGGGFRTSPHPTKSDQEAGKSVRFQGSVALQWGKLIKPERLDVKNFSDFFSKIRARHEAYGALSMYERSKNHKSLAICRLVLGSTRSLRWMIC